jgi:hypothetical protein
MCAITFTNIVEAVRPQMTEWGMRIAVWIRTAIHTQNVYCLLLVHYNNGCTTRRIVGFYVHCLVNASTISFLLKYLIIMNSQDSV